MGRGGYEHGSGVEACFAQDCGKEWGGVAQDCLTWIVDALDRRVLGYHRPVGDPKAKGGWGKEFIDERFKNS